MVKLSLIVAAVALALGGCATQDAMKVQGTQTQGGPSVPGMPKSRDLSEEFLLGFDLRVFPLTATLTSACDVRVYVGANDEIFVSQLIVATSPCPQGMKRKVTWRLDLDSTPTNYTFPLTDGISFNYPSLTPNPPAVCSRPSSKVIECAFDPPASGFLVYQYSINVLKNNTITLTKDPYVFNN